jgi:hypothetical protein
MSGYQGVIRLNERQSRGVNEAFPETGHHPEICLMANFFLSREVGPV